MSACFHQGMSNFAIQSASPGALTNNATGLEWSMPLAWNGWHSYIHVCVLCAIAAYVQFSDTCNLDRSLLFCNLGIAHPKMVKNYIGRFVRLIFRKFSLKIGSYYQLNTKSVYLQLWLCQKVGFLKSGHLFNENMFL